MIYDHIIRSADSNKIAVNKLLGKLVKEQTEDHLQALILDSPSFLTAKTLKKSGFLPQHIHIPNYPDYNKMSKKSPYNTCHAWLNEWLEDYRRDFRGTISFAFLDFCSCFDGNKNCVPKEDIKKYFDLKYPANDSLLAVTLSHRNTKKERRQNDIIRLNSLVAKSALDNGYSVIPREEGWSYNGMFFCIYNIITNDNTIKISQPKTKALKREPLTIKPRKKTAKTNIKIRTLKPRKKTAKTNIKIRTLITKGLTVKEICNELGITVVEYNQKLKTELW